MIKKMPDAIVIISCIIVLIIGLTWIIPAGEFDKQEKVVNGMTKNVVVEGSYHTVEPAPQSPLSIFTAPLRGFADNEAAEVIAFIFLVGGAFFMLLDTGAVDAGLQKLVKLAYAKPASKEIILAALIVFFSLGGSTFGMAEEVLVFLLITIPMAYALGYDTIVGVAVPFVGSGAGFAGAFLNPFTIGIAQGISEIPIFSGINFRLIVWLIFTTLAIIFILAYARKISKDPTKSLMYGKPKADNLGELKDEPLTIRRKLILLLFGAAIVMLLIGAKELDWYITEISGLFLALGIISSIIAGFSAQRMVAAFYKGCKEVLTAAIIVAFSKAILIVAQDGKIIDTVLFSLSNAAEGLPKEVSVQIMLYVQTGINFFIPSGSGQAAVTMPLMAPLSDLMGIGRQTAVLAYQFGDGITNLIIPTSGLTMGILAIAKIPYNIWIKWIWKLIVTLYIVAMIFLAIAASNSAVWDL